ncbi:hypothetical protein JHK82_030467 [Glycine max]|nr:hypothetical protein JHK85_031104 [Glycine max]KAG4993737.1 hypothetical protein JHK86_030564 [Glycine max]KAG5123730.1 hypothetical protein JHK82_030467 [Glycine max]KAG5145147.1 hypothetical protein JHK84_030690 [Glycine max]
MACTPKPKGDPSVAASIAAAFFKLVIVIEVSYEDDSFRESFTNTDIHRLASKRFIVKYDNLMADEKIMKKLREFHNNGWWEGHVTYELENERFAMYFTVPKEQLVFSKEQLMLYREWLNHDWVPPLYG